SVPNHTSLLSPPSSAAAPYSLCLHDALPIYDWSAESLGSGVISCPVALSMICIASLSISSATAVLHSTTTAHFRSRLTNRVADRSEEHTSELQSRENLVCRLLLEKKKARHDA